MVYMLILITNSITQQSDDQRKAHNLLITKENQVFQQEDQASNFTPRTISNNT